MAEYVYIAESPQYPGIVKIGRTDRAIAERMDELSLDNYGLPSENIVSEWEAVKIIEVQDNEHAEAVLHAHFDHLRVTDSRELFYTDDPYGLAHEAADVVDGTIMTADIIEIGNLFDPLSIVALGAGIVLAARTFAPENKSTKKAEKFMRDWELRTEARYKNAETRVGKFIFGSYNMIFKTNKAIVEKTTGFVEGTAVLFSASLNSIGIKNNILNRLVDRKINERRAEIARNPPTIIARDDSYYKKVDVGSEKIDKFKKISETDSIDHDPSEVYLSTEEIEKALKEELEKALREELSDKGD